MVNKNRKLGIYPVKGAIQFKKLGIGILSVGIILIYIFKTFNFNNNKSYIEKDRDYFEKVLRQTLGLPTTMEASPKVPVVVFIDQVIPHHLINSLPHHQLDHCSYDTLDYKDHIIPTFFKKNQGIFIADHDDENNHCFWMVMGFLSVAGQGNHKIYLPSNSPEPLEDKFVVPYPQWKKIIKRLENRERIDIINCSYSYGNDIYPHESYEAIKRGVLVIVSAGNDFDKDKDLYRSNFTKLYKLAKEMNSQGFNGAMIIVGAYNPFSSSLIDYSNRPFEEDVQTQQDFVTAPCFYIDGNKAYMNGGTSIAASYVSAVAALLMKRFPSLKGHHIADIIKASSQGPDRIVNYREAVELGKKLNDNLNPEPFKHSINLHKFFNYN